MSPEMKPPGGYLQPGDGGSSDFLIRICESFPTSVKLAATEFSFPEGASTLRLLSVMLLGVLALGGLQGGLAHAQTSTWIGGAGNWAPCPQDGGNALWDTCASDVYPTGSYSAIIQGGPVTLASGNGISIVNLSVAAGDSVIVTPGYLNITGSAIANNGTITVGPGDGFNLNGGPATTLSGSGTVTMTDPSARFWSLNGTATFTNQQTIQGQGAFSLGMNFVNQGTINANAGTLSLQPTSAVNTGTMEASSGSILSFTNGAPAPYNNTGGIIKALSGGTVNLENGVYTGGALTTVGTGLITATGNAVLNALANSGTLQIPVGGAATLQNAINNTGIIQVPSSTLSMSGNVTLSGTGSLLMSGSSNLRQLGSNDTLTNQELIHGSGTIYELPLTNQGTIAADSKSNTLTLAGGLTTNTATLEASGGGTLEIETVVNNSGGIIKALNGSTVILTNGFNGSVNGGTLTTSGSGTVQSQNGLLDGTVNVPTNAGKLEAASFDLYVQGTINNTGTIALTGNSCLVLNQASTLTGAGKLTMASTSCIYGSGMPFTNQSTIVGAGSIGDSNPMPIINHGTILANQTSPLLVVPDATGFTNTGKLTVNAGSTLNIDGVFNNLSNTGTLTGGTYNVTGLLGFPNAVVTNAAGLTLTGAAAEILISNTNTSALSALAANAAKGVVTLNRGQLLTTSTSFSNAGKITVGTGSGFTVGGRYKQTAGTTTVDGTLTAPAGVSLQNGTLQGQGTVAAAVISKATFTAGDSTSQAGKLSVAGSYTQDSTGVLSVAIGGTQVGTQYSQVAVSNGVSLNGTLNVTLINGFVPTIGTTFVVLTGSALTGQFTTVNGLSINSGEHFQISYKPKEIALTVVTGS